jgi:transcriptional regulator with XRE-family HTH domain
MLSYMSMETSQAVRELRKAYGEAQQAFATRLEMSMASIANYEAGSRVPDGASAVKLARAAAAKSRMDLQRVFDAIIHDAMGGLVAPIQNEDEHRKIRAVQFILFDERFADKRQRLAELLAPVEAHLRTVEKRLAKSAERLSTALDAANERARKGAK